MPFTGQQYDATKTLVKGGIEFLKVMGWGSAALAGVYAVSDQIPADWETFKASWPLLIVAFITAAIRAANNYRKNS